MPALARRVPPPRGADRAEPAGPAKARAAAGSAYTVRRGDTLSKIANEYRPPSATLEQMLVALYASNKEAFDGNMNRLRAGTILNIPTPEMATGVSPAEATKIVRVQAADWRGYQDRVAGSAPPAEGAGGRVAGGKIGTTVEEKTPAVVPGRDQLKVSREAGARKAPPERRSPRKSSRATRR